IAERLAEIFLVESDKVAVPRDPIIPFDKQPLAPGNLDDRRLHRVQADRPGQCQSECFQDAQATQTRALRLEDMRGDFADRGKAYRAILRADHGDLVLRTGQRQAARRAEQRPFAFSHRLIGRWQQIRQAQARVWRTRRLRIRRQDADRAGTFTTDASQQREIVPQRDTQSRCNGFAHRAFRQQVAKPIASDRALIRCVACGQADGQRDRSRAVQVLRGIGEPPIFRRTHGAVDVQFADKAIEQADLQAIDHGASTTRSCRPKTASTGSSLWRLMLGLPRSNSLMKRSPVPDNPASWAWVRPCWRRAARTAEAMAPSSSEEDSPVPDREDLPDIVARPLE